MTQNTPKNNYPIEKLLKIHPELKPFVVEKSEHLTLDFSNKEAVFHLNKALLKTEYGVSDWNLPSGYLSPGIPGRMQYLEILKPFINQNNVRGLDIGTGASAIYCILAASKFNWRMTGVDANPEAYEWAKKNVAYTKSLHNLVAIRYQDNNSNIFVGAIKTGEFYDVTLCNPPFYSSENEALKVHALKNKNLNLNVSEQLIGHAKELWCNGGEALFIKRMIKESKLVKDQVGLFSSLVSNKKNLPKLIKQLHKQQAKETIKTLKIGNKISHVLIWEY